jgi:hypothetical protein
VFIQEKGEGHQDAATLCIFTSSPNCKPVSASRMPSLGMTTNEMESVSDQFRA